jgi:predicted Holliday junction resolvase-like endonuclease
MKIFLTGWSALVLLMVLVNILVSLGNHSIQTEVGERQQEIAQTIQLEALNRQLITVLANMALKTNDARLKKVLADSGINLDAAPESAAEKK